MKKPSQQPLAKLWKIVVHPIQKSSNDMIYNSREELVKTLKHIGLNDTLIWLLFLRGLIKININGERLLIQIIEIVEKAHLTIK